MIRGSIIAGAMLLANPALAADDKPPVPGELQAAWARDGHCNKTAERLEVSAFRAGWGTGHTGGVHYEASRRAIVWDDEGKTDFFALGPRGLQMFHVKADGERERLVKCPGKIIRRR
jgi:hypothetical protein